VRLVLWDVDGTLIRGGAAGRLAFADAVRDVLGVEVPEERLPRMSGKTDPQIALEILEHLGIAAPDARLPAIEAALERALSARAPQLRTEGVVLPGVRALVAGLSDAGALQTLVTGNVAANARTKLAALGLLTEQPTLRLDIGAYGSDDRDRDNLVPVALRRAEAAGFDVDARRTWVVGDTPRDLACARAAGVRCLLVATGTYTLDQVRDARPDAAVADLTDGLAADVLTTFRRWPSPGEPAHRSPHGIAASCRGRSPSRRAHAGSATTSGSSSACSRRSAGGSRPFPSST
jgi:phosphoglycolate phosphatase